MRNEGKTGAVIVAYHPELGRLEALIQSLFSQVERIIIINNGPTNLLLSKSDETIQVEPIGQNIGVGAAINHGVELLIKQDFSRALLLDQDSQIGEGFVATLTRHLDDHQTSGHSVAAIGPRIRDHNDAQSAPFIRFRLPFNKRLDQEQGCAACDFLITSGCLINLDHWPTVGPMRASWFIDNIDLEWCFRAQRKGLTILGCFDTTLDHRIGDREQLLGIITYRRHSPERLYTMMRNRLFLYRSGAPIAFIVQDSLRAIGKFGLFSLIPPRWQHAKAMLSGLRDGLKTRPVP